MKPPPARPAAPPLWRQLQAAAQLVAGVRAGESLTARLAAVPDDLRPGAQALSFHALRWLGLADGLRAQLARKRPPAAADALLCTALALLAVPGGAAYAAFTLVDQAVEAAQRDARLRPHAGLLNACLRRYLREADALLAALGVAGMAPAASAGQGAAMPAPLRSARGQGGHAASLARWNHPPWWVRRLRQDHPQHWRDVLQAAQAHPPMVLRVNARRTTVPAFIGLLAQAGMAAEALGGSARHAVRLAQPCPVARIPGFAQGLASVQSAAAQQAAPLLLDGLAGDAPRLLDACAAPGGKTAHLLELCPGAQVTALEVDAARARRIHDNLARLGLHADVRVADAARTDAWWDGQAFDAILLDAPCSASGIVSRHPDVRWLRRESDIARLAAQQDRLLHALWPLLRPGGRLLYATCSVFRQEGDARIAAFAARWPQVRTLPAPGHLLPFAAPPLAGVGDNAARDDGFYYALLEKPPA